MAGENETPSNTQESSVLQGSTATPEDTALRVKQRKEAQLKITAECQQLVDAFSRGKSSKDKAIADISATLLLNSSGRFASPEAYKSTFRAYVRMVEDSEHSKAGSSDMSPDANPSQTSADNSDGVQGVTIRWTNSFSFTIASLAAR